MDSYTANPTQAVYGGDPTSKVSCLSWADNNKLLT